MQTDKLFLNIESIQLFGFFIALLIAYVLTPFIRSRALRLGFLDKPSERRIHLKPIPRLGGVSIYLSLFLTSLIFLGFYKNYNLLEPHTFPLLGILAGGTIIFFLGLLDDIEPLNSKVKLLIQFIAASVAWYLGVRILQIANPFYHSDFYFFKLSLGGMVINFDPFLSYVITIGWIIIITNAINLLDGMDGLATGISLICAIAIWSISLGQRISQPAGALMSATLAGSLLGFLRWNFNPARIFLGDSGAYLAGFMLSSLAVCCVMKSVTLAIMTPMLVIIFALPIADVGLAVIRRLMGKKSILEPDKEHIHHRVLAFGISQKIASYIFYALSILLGFTATYMMSRSSCLRFAVLIILVSALILFFTYVINWKHQKIFRKY